MPPMLPHNRLSAVIALIAIGLLASLALDWPATAVSLMGLTFELSGRTLLGFVLVGLVWAGVDVALRHHPQIEPGSLGVLPIGWISAVCALLALTTAAEYYVAYPSTRWRAGVQFALRLTTYLAAILLYTAIQLGITSRSVATLAVAVVSAVLAWRLCAGDDRTAPRLRTRQMSELASLGGTTLAHWLLFAALGVLTAASCWLFGLWTKPPLPFGLVLVVLLYLSVGLLKQFLLRTLTQRVVVEYLAAPLPGELILHIVSRRARASVGFLFSHAAVLPPVLLPGPPRRAEQKCEVDPAYRSAGGIRAANTGWNCRWWR
jgi:hypothetical protein